MDWLNQQERESSRDRADRPTYDDVSALSALLASDDLEAARDLVLGFVDRHVPVEDILLELIVPAAERAGEDWDDDRCTFCDVTILLSRLQCLVRAVVSAGPASKLARRGQLVVLVAAPGEQHVLGLVVLEELLHAAGWDVRVEAADALAGYLRGRYVEAIGITACRAERLTALTELVTAARAASKNPDIVVLVGGQCFLGAPELVAQVGATATAVTPIEAVRVIVGLVDAKSDAKA